VIALPAALRAGGLPAGGTPDGLDDEHDREGQQQERDQRRQERPVADLRAVHRQHEGVEARLPEDRCDERQDDVAHQ
jgi:hypothetical protein